MKCRTECTRFFHGTSIPFTSTLYVLAKKFLTSGSLLRWSESKHSVFVRKKNVIDLVCVKKHIHRTFKESYVKKPLWL
jgi:hypothetical protein